MPGLTHDVPAWGYPFHAACWDLLLVTKNPYTGSFSERHLFNIFLSCNAERGLIDLGHEYGGLAYRFPELSELLPGEEQRLILSGTKTEYSENPVNIDKLAEILEECSAQPVVTDVCCVRGHEFGVRDPFSTLPLELLESILQLLPSQYILNFKLASRIAASTPLSASFWRSRFALGFEYEHIFEARQQSQRGLNWRHLYFSLRPLGNLPALMNRKRIWNLATLLRHLVETASSTPCYGKALQSLLEPKASNREHSAAEQWLTAERILIKSIDIFRTGACALRTTTITLPSQLYGICVSTVTIGHKSYIFGFRLLQVSGEDLFIGYIHPDREASVFFSPRQDILQPIHLSGFVLAMDYGGLRAISFITHTGQRSSWIGELKGIPKHHLISNRTEFLRVQARFDVGLCHNMRMDSNLYPGSENSFGFRAE